jgi:WhiB family redox-sensing transcriptional regulator
MIAAESLDDYLDPTLEWREFAVCKGQLDLFFARKAERPEARARREAKALRLCTVCVVRAHCRQAARDNHEYGYWAGESEEDRHLAGYTVTAPIGVRARLAQVAGVSRTG